MVVFKELFESSSESICYETQNDDWWYHYLWGNMCQIMSFPALFVGIPLYSLFSLVFLLQIFLSELQIPWINPGFPLCFVAEATEPMATFLGQTPYQSPYQTKSFVWKYCTKLGKDEAVCDICGRHYNIGRGSTSQLRKHLKSWHQIVDESAMN